MKVLTLKSPFLISLITSFVFFIAAFLTLGSYGPSWDETIHFRRGQAYLHYFLTGQKTYNLPNYNLQGTLGDPKIVPVPRRSFYQVDIQNGEYFFNQDIGHPPLNDELAALSNYIFYQKLGIIDDLSSYHLFNILASSLLVFAVVFLAQKYWGFFPSLVVFLALVTYPLFWAESHFNVKDPPLAAFFSLTILCFVLCLEKKSLKYLIISAIFFTLGLGTKLNILFLPLILLPYVFFNKNKVFASSAYKDKLRNFKKRYFITFVLISLAVGIIFIGSWPYLWQDIPQRLLSILSYYKEIGTASKYQPEGFFILGFNTYPIKWIILTTPPLVLVLVMVGIISAWINRNLWNKITIILLLWLFVPILRVTIPGASIYGGIRQILEFLPAMVILSGLGAWQIVEYFKTKRSLILIRILIILIFLWPLFINFKLHPNENVYFNFLIGGLKGAQDKNFPSWGNSLGNAYKNGTEWINNNAEKDSKLALIQGTPSNVPPLFLRKDIKYLVNDDISTNFTFFSGIKREGEYLMELTFDDSGKDFYYVWEYVQNFLIPVYEYKVDGVAILKIWKNDLEHTKANLKLNEQMYKGKINLTKDNNSYLLELADEVTISHFQLNFNNGNNCLGKVSGVVDISSDKINWVRERSIIPEPQLYRKSNLETSTINFYIAGKLAKVIKVTLSNLNNCKIFPVASVFVLR